MISYTYTVHLYALYDRAFEDCYAKIHVQLPDDYEVRAPKQDQIGLEFIELDKPTEMWLTGTYCTDIPKLIKKIQNDLGNIHEHIIDHLSEELPLETDRDFDDWFKSAGLELPIWEAIG